MEWTVTLKRTLLAVTLALGALSALAQPTTGEVRKIDKAQGRITLQHAEIRNLDMPAMTMVFRVRDKSWLDALAVGDRVVFEAEKIDGHFVVTGIRKAP